MNKEDTLRKLIHEQELKYNNMMDELKDIIERINESPSASESHSDTSRSQGSDIADDMNVKSQNLQNQIIYAKNYRFNTIEKITTGSMVKLESDKNNSDWYFILPFFGGQVLKQDSSKVYVISAQTPIAQKLLGQKKGYEFSLANKKYNISDVL